jgi:glycerol kinase
MLQAHIVRAAIEASAFQTVEVAQAMQQDSHHKLPFAEMRVDGGMTQNGVLMQVGGWVLLVGWRIRGEFVVLSFVVTAVVIAAVVVCSCCIFLLFFLL